MKEMKFEDAMIKLEGEVKKLESGNMTLDESIATFEEAVKLIGICNKQLENAEQRVRLLIETDGEDLPDNERTALLAEILSKTAELTSVTESQIDSNMSVFTSSLEVSI